MRREAARAKVNLALHVVGRRGDGYHELESLVAFAEAADLLEAEAADELSLEIEGPFGAELRLDPTPQNLVLRAAAELERRLGRSLALRFRLTKRLPVASGIGGGSADAAAALRLLAHFAELDPSDPRLAETARAVGADVPVCLASGCAWMRGLGERLDPVAPFPRIPALLVNPGVAVSTAEVFGALGLAPGEATPFKPFEQHPDRFGSVEELVGFLAQARNDLEPAACAIAPVIGEAIDLLHDLPGARLARMSGSGATCFGLFDEAQAAEEAVRRLREARPGWWCEPTTIG